MVIYKYLVDEGVVLNKVRQSETLVCPTQLSKEFYKEKKELNKWGPGYVSSFGDCCLSSPELSTVLTLGHRAE